jgi:hypothetical protein
MTRVRTVVKISNDLFCGQWASITKNPSYIDPGYSDKDSGYSLTINNNHGGVRSQISIELTLEDLKSIYDQIEKELILKLKRDPGELL